MIILCTNKHPCRRRNGRHARRIVDQHPFDGARDAAEEPALGEDVQVITASVDVFRKGIHHRMVQVCAFYKSVVHKKVLIASCLLRGLRFTYKTVDIHVIGLLLHTHQFSIVAASHNLENALLQASLFQVKNFLPVRGK